jgi:hypothetical protein
MSAEATPLNSKCAGFGDSRSSRLCGLAQDESPLIQKTWCELVDVAERFKALDREYWGDTLASVT